MVCFVNVQSVERIIFSIFNQFNVEWRQHTFVNLHKRVDITDFSRTAASRTPASRPYVGYVTKEATAICTSVWCPT